MKLPFLACAAVAVVLVLAGCAPTAPNADPTPAPTSRAPTSIATPTPVPSATASPTKPALADLVVSADGIGPLLIGAPIPVAPTATAVETWKPTECGPTAGSPYNGAWVPNYPTVATVFQQKSSVITFASKYKDSKLVFAVVWSPELKTVDGLGVGSKAADISTVYGSAVTIHHLPTTDLYTVRGSTGELVFEVASKFQTGLTSWTKSAVGTVVWMRVEVLSTKPFSIANSDVGGSCSA